MAPNESTADMRENGTEEAQMTKNTNSNLINNLINNLIKSNEERHINKTGHETNKTLTPTESEQRQRSIDLESARASMMSNAHTEEHAHRANNDDIEQRSEGTMSNDELHMSHTNIASTSSTFPTQHQNASIADQQSQTEAAHASNISQPTSSMQNGADSNSKLIDKIRAENQCGICLNVTIDPLILVKCGHSFCTKCIHDMMNIIERDQCLMPQPFTCQHWPNCQDLGVDCRPNCPYCRQPIVQIVNCPNLTATAAAVATNQEKEYHAEFVREREAIKKRREYNRQRSRARRDRFARPEQPIRILTRNRQHPKSYGK